ncbi:MAG: phosphoribosylglycinamide formyltransferase [Actinomycetales bacterium]|nr:phosphoribosylglycinamide formyltransferase [Actinomycetales bacterium]
MTDPPASPGTPARLVVLASGAGSNLGAILTACATGALPAVIVGVASDRPTAGALARARRAGVPTAVIPATPQRAVSDHRLAETVARWAPDLVVLAGYLRILGPAFIDPQRARGVRIINLHPSLPGDLIGLGAISRAHAEAVAGQRQQTGVMVHEVIDAGVDDGPVIATECVPIPVGMDLAEFTALMHTVEHRVLLRALSGLLDRPRP